MLETLRWQTKGGQTVVWLMTARYSSLYLPSGAMLQLCLIWPWKGGFFAFVRERCGKQAIIGFFIRRLCQGRRLATARRSNGSTAQTTDLTAVRCRHSFLVCCKIRSCFVKQFGIIDRGPYDTRQNAVEIALPSCAVICILVHVNNIARYPFRRIALRVGSLRAKGCLFVRGLELSEFAFANIVESRGAGGAFRNGTRGATRFSFSISCPSLSNGDTLGLSKSITPGLLIGCVDNFPTQGIGTALRTVQSGFRRLAAD
ncbi:hypothetical protein MRB53_041791 [Persea americana]|nr:hypothetical protein MRB53_041791 [Persea americana]